MSKLIVFDLETTGLDESRHEVIQFAAVAVDRSWREIESLELKATFNRETASHEALAINGYDPDVWAKEACSPAVARGRISDFLRRHATLEKVSARTGRPYMVARLCGHNAAGFDGRFLAAWFKRADAFLPGACFECLDTLALARWASFVAPPGPKDHRLGSLCEWLGVDPGEAHRALDDVRATVAVARRLLSGFGVYTPPAEPPPPADLGFLFQSGEGGSPRFTGRVPTGARE